MFKPLMMTALLFTAPAAVARETPAGPTVRVTTADLDLTTAAGRKMLDRRISKAIEQACPDADLAPQVGMLPMDRCRQIVAADARRQRGALLVLAGIRKSGKSVQLAAADASR